MSDAPRLRISTVFVITVVVGAGAFAAGRGTLSSHEAFDTARSERAKPESTDSVQSVEPLGRGLGSSSDLPPGHPPIATGAGEAPARPMPTKEASTDASDERTLAWTVPSRWQVVPNASSMRLATYRVPRSAEDSEDPEMSVVQAGGSVDANVERWIAQFDPSGQKSAKRSTRTSGTLEITVVEVEGTYRGAMMAPGSPGKERGQQAGVALVGAIVVSPSLSLPTFFKLTGPAKSVRSARAEVDVLLSSLKLR